jgi:hypothetical protein
MKRVLEFLTNAGLTEAASQLEVEFTRAFARIRHATSLIEQISFAKNIGHLRGLGGDYGTASVVVNLAAQRARSAGLYGQLRQLDRLARGISAKDVRGALETFRV